MDKMVLLSSTISVSFKRFQLPLFLTLLGKLLIPTIYNSCRVYILGSIHDETVISIISQLVWVTVIMEVMEEALLMPLYHCFGEAAAREDQAELIPKVRSGFYVCAMFYVVFCSVIAIFTPQLIAVMGVDSSLGLETAKYIRLSLIGVFLTGIVKMFGIVLVIKKKSLFLNIILFVQLISAVISDTFFFSDLSVSLKLGSQGVAYSSIIQQFATTLTTFILAAVTLQTPLPILFSSQKTDFSWIRIWTKQGFFSGFESFVRNFVYLLVVLRGMNLLHEQDVYWIANSFIWSWLLVPVLALSELLRQDVATCHPRESFAVITPAYCCLSIAVVLVWAASIPGWKWFIVTILNAENRDSSLINNLVLQLMVGYIFFIVSHLNRSVFYAKGKIQYLCITSTAASVLMIFLFVLVIYEFVPATLQIIAGIFSVNMVFGSIVSAIMMKILVKILSTERNNLVA